MGIHKKMNLKSGCRCKCGHKGHKGIPVTHTTPVKDRLRKKIAERKNKK